MRLYHENIYALNANNNKTTTTTTIENINDDAFISFSKYFTILGILLSL